MTPSSPTMHELVKYSQSGFDADICFTWKPDQSAPEGLLIEIQGNGRPNHSMRVSCRYDSREDALDEGKRLVGLYVNGSASSRT